MRSKILKSLLIILILIVVSLVLVSLLIRTDTVQRKIVGFVEDSVSKNLGQEFRIGRVDFDVLIGVVIQNMQLDIDGTDFLKVETVEIGYPLELSNIVKQLAQKRITVDRIKVKGLSVNFKKRVDGSWNYSALQNKQGKKDEGHMENSAATSWKINILDAGIYESEIMLSAYNNKPARIINIKELETSFDLNMSGNSEFGIDRGNIFIQPYGLSFENLLADIEFSKDEINVKELRFQLNGSPVNLSATIGGKDNKKFNINSEVREYKFKKGLINVVLNGAGEFNDITNINGEFKVNIENSEYLGNKFTFNLDDIKIRESRLLINNAVITGDLGKATLNASTDIKKLADKNSDNEFQLILSAENIKYSEFINLSALTEPHDESKKEIFINAEIHSHGYFNSKNNFNIDTDIERLAMSGAAGDAGFAGHAKLSNQSINLKVNGEVKDLDIRYFTEDQNYRSSVNFEVNIDTVLPLDLDIKKAKGSIDVDILKSSISGMIINGGEIYSRFQDENISNARINLNSDNLLIELTGSTIKSKLDFIYNVESNDLNFISGFKPDLAVSGYLKAGGRIRGDIFAPTVEYLLNTKQNRFKSIQTREIVSRGEVNFRDDHIDIVSEGEIVELVISDNQFARIDYRIGSEGKDLVFDVSALKNENNSIELDFKLTDIREKRLIEFKELLLNIEGTIYKNKSPFYLSLRDGYKLRGFNLYEGASSINANLTKEKDLIVSEVSIESLNIENINKFFGAQEQLSGILNGNFGASGAMQNMKIRANLEIYDFRYKEFESDYISMKSSYAKPKMAIDIKSRYEGQDTIRLSGFLTTGLDLKEIGNSIKNADMQLTMVSSGLNLSPLSKLVDTVTDINGYLNSDLHIRGKISSPMLHGDVSLQNIGFKLKNLNNRFVVSDGNINFNGTNAVLTNMVIVSGDGHGYLDGSLDFRDLAYVLKARFDQVTLKHKTLKTNVSGDISLAGREKRMKMEGAVKLNKARVSLKDGMSRKTSDIKFVNGEEDDSEEIVIKDNNQDGYFRNNLAMDLDIKIAKNSWVRGKGANVELKGDIYIVKDYEDDMVLTGNILTIRGTYKIFGKLFKILKGNVNFPGIKGFNPLLDITALYNVSDINVFVDIGGDVESPKVSLRSDPTLQETDIISYLLFGSPSNKLGTGERSSLNQVAAGIAGGAVLNEFKGLLGEEFSPDVLLFSNSSAGPELEVGKYLNDDLYVAYERKTSSDASTPIPTDNVKVEYRLFDYLSVASEVGSEQAGGDLFFKFDF